MRIDELLQLSCKLSEIISDNLSYLEDANYHGIRNYILDEVDLEGIKDFLARDDVEEWVSALEKSRFDFEDYKYITLYMNYIEKFRDIEPYSACDKLFLTLALLLNGMEDKFSKKEKTRIMLLLLSVCTIKRKAI